MVAKGVRTGLAPWAAPVGPRRYHLRLPGAVVVLGGLAVAAAGGGVAARSPRVAIACVVVSALIAGVWARPALAGYVIIGTTPLLAGIDRGTVIPVLRPNEALYFGFAAALTMRAIVGLRTAHVPRVRLSRLVWAILLMAVANSVVPLLWMLLRHHTPTADDYLYALVLWKLLAVYAIVRASITTDRQIRNCLWISVCTASVVAVIGILQALDLLGVRGLLAAYYVPFGYVGALSKPRGGSTLALPAATADLMIFNLAIVVGLLLRGRRHRRLLLAAAVLFMFGTLAAGEFSSAFGLMVATVALAVVTGSWRIPFAAAPVGVAGLYALWPVVTERLSGFQSEHGLPASWIGRMRNLSSYFWPQLFSDWNFLLGVRPAARIPVANQATGYIWIESGYTWLLWGGGIPLLFGYVFFVSAGLRRGWHAARFGEPAAGIAGIAVVVAVVVCTVLMVFDPHITYRGSADALFSLLALTRWHRGETFGGDAGGRGTPPEPARRWSSAPVRSAQGGAVDGDQ
jgi:hypothetical protein